MDTLEDFQMWLEERYIALADELRRPTGLATKEELQANCERLACAQNLIDEYWRKS